MKLNGLFCGRLAEHGARKKTFHGVVWIPLFKNARMVEAVASGRRQSVPARHSLGDGWVVFPLVFGMNQVHLFADHICFGTQ